MTILRVRLETRERCTISVSSLKRFATLSGAGAIDRPHLANRNAHGRFRNIFSSRRRSFLGAAVRERKRERERERHVSRTWRSQLAPRLRIPLRTLARLFSFFLPLPDPVRKCIFDPRPDPRAPSSRKSLFPIGFFSQQREQNSRNDFEKF